MIVEIYEDNAGQVYLSWEAPGGRETWGLGPVTPDMYGEGANHCVAVVSGEWVPNEDDGQTREELSEDLVLVARFDDARDDFEDHTRLCGAGGRLFVHGRVDA